MLPRAADSARPRRAGEPGDEALPPSAAIRTRFRTLTERTAPSTAARGTKRYMVDDSPNGIVGRHREHRWAASGLETPVRGSVHTAAPLVDTILRPQRLFSFGSPPSGSRNASGVAGSPARSILESTQRESEHLGRMETLKRDLERTTFDLQQVELDRERDREDAQQKRQRLEADLLAQTKRVEKLERDRKWLAGQEQRLDDQRRAVETDMAALKKTHDRRLDEAAATAHDLQQKLEDANRALHRARAEYVQEAEAQQERLAAAERAIAEMKAQRNGAEGADARAQRNGAEGADARADPALQYTVDSLQRQLRDRDRDVEELQERLQALSGDVDAAPSRSRVEQLERDLHEQCTYIKAVEQQNRHLRSEAARLADAAGKYEKEHEINAALEAKVQRLSEQQAEHLDLEARLDALQQEREQWARVFQHKDASSPFAAARTVAEQRHTIQMLETKVDTLQAAVAATDQQLKSATGQAQQHQQDHARLEAEVAASRQQTARLEAARQHAVREAEFLREQLHSYDHEEAAMMPGNYDSQKADRIRRLEKFVDEQRACIAALETGQAVPTTTSAVSADLLQSYRQEAEGYEQELSTAREEHQRLMARFEGLEKETARLEHQLGAGLGYNPRTTRVLQLIDNPSAQDFAIRSEKLKDLAAENSALLERIRQLEETAPASTDLASREGESAASGAFFHTIDNLHKEKQSLEKQLEDSAKLISRYKKEWKRKASELREVVYTILGYRVDFLANGSVRFTSAYAADVDQSFVFASGHDNQGVMQLSGGGSRTYLQGLNNDIRYWVQERGSIPGLMATITLQNFEANPEQESQQQ
ncbi:coiled-coil domain-containing protein mad1 [Coemansia sp. RSA 552]|nr:coiled-coil domain-containing protein mad1 [Coemansia sp. RSA 552]